MTIGANPVPLDPLTNAPETHYLFIDGGYLRDLYGQCIKNVFDVDPVIDYARIKIEYRARKAFYYDSLHDLPKQGESPQQTRERVSAQRAELDRIQALDGFHVRLGSMSGTVRKARQKQVDVLLAVDMLTHGFLKNMSVVTLISGDLDFLPVVETLTRSGTYVRVVHERRSGSRELRHAADVGTVITVETLLLWLRYDVRNRCKPPDRIFPGTVPGPPEQIFKRGMLKGKPVDFYKNGGAYVLFAREYEGPQALRLQHEDPKLIERYVSATDGAIEWEPEEKP